MARTGLTLSSKIIRNPEMVSSDMDGETVMMSMENGEYYGLDPIGSRIWDLIEKEMSIEQLIGVLLEEYDVDRNQCEEDTFAFLNELLDKNLLTVL